MILNEFLSQDEQQKKVLIVSDRSRANALIRTFELKENRPVKNVSCETLIQVATKLYQWIQSESGFDQDTRYLPVDEAETLFRMVLIENISSLESLADIDENTKAKMMDVVTASEYYRMVNLARSNGWTKAVPDAEAKNRIDDLKLLISKYEDKLNEKKAVDDIAIYGILAERINGDARFLKDVGIILGANRYYIKEDAQTYTGIQNRLLNLLGCKEVSLFGETEFTVKALKNKGKITDISFFKGYGPFNEANYVAYDILKNKYNYGDVTVLYTSSAQQVPISSALKGNEIPMTLLSNHSIQDNPYIALARSILAWAKDDFSEKRLESIFASSVLFYAKENEEKESSEDNSDKNDKQEENKKSAPKNMLSGEAYYDLVLAARNRFGEDSVELGWGYERNLKFADDELMIVRAEIEKIKTDTAMEEDKRKSKLRRLEKRETQLIVLGKLLEIFSEKDHPSTIFNKLVNFISVYGKKTLEYPVGMGKIKELAAVLGYDDRELSLEECIDYLDSFLAALTTKDQESSKAVSVVNTFEWRQLERPHVYVIGLSLKDMQTNTAESPVLRDVEMEKYLGEGYKPTIANEKLRSNDNLIRTLLTFSGKAGESNVTLGYSDFDTGSFFENNPSSFYREMLSEFNGPKLDEICEFVYGNPDKSVRYDSSNYEKIPSDKIKKSIESNIHSSSSLEAFINCPKRFAYDKVLGIPNNEYVEENYSSWLDAKQRGSFFHFVSEEYCNKKLIRNRAESYDTQVDDLLIDECITKYIKDKRLGENIPYSYERLVWDAVADIKDMARNYFACLLKDIHKDGSWRVLATEQQFLDSVYGINSYDGQTWSFIMRGSIDRIDYRIDRSDASTTPEIHFRIADYKTGKKEKKEKDFNKCALIQWKIYENALTNGKTIINKGQADEKKLELIDYLKRKVSMLENDDSLIACSWSFDGFRYDFPTESKKELVSYPIKSDSKNGINRLKMLLTLITKDQTYIDYKDLLDSTEDIDGLTKGFSLQEDDVNEIKLLTEGIFENNSKQPEKNCEYCDYKNLCDHYKAGEVK